MSDPAPHTHRPDRVAAGWRARLPPTPAGPCTYTSEGRPCGLPAITRLTLQIGGEEYVTARPLRACTIHLITALIVMGAATDDTAKAVEAVGRAVAADILREDEDRERTPPQ